MEKPEGQTTNRETLLAEYRAGIKASEGHWAEYMKTGSNKAFGDYVALNRAQSAVYADLVQMGMTLDEIQDACIEREGDCALDSNLY